MRKQLWAVLLLTSGLLLFSGRSFAHHSWGAYDLTKWITLRGTVSRFDWANPHTSIAFDVRDQQGRLQHWIAGGPSPSRMNRGGWDKNTVKPGAQITVVGNPARDGSPMMRLGRVTLANGQELIVYGDR